MRCAWLVVAACSSAPPRTEPVRTEPVRTAPAPAGSAQPLLATPPTRDRLRVYSPTEAVEDALSSPLQHLGTGPWFGIFRIDACAFRNERVIVVDIYCTHKEMSSFGVIIMSPERGRVRLYAEATKTPISTIRRDRYHTFKAEMDPAWPEALSSLGMDFAALQTYEERYYHVDGPACFMNKSNLPEPAVGCIHGGEPLLEAWKTAAESYLDSPPDSWYRLVVQLRALVAAPR